MMDFMVRAFDGVKIEEIHDRDGNITHGEIRIDDSVIMIGRETAESPSFRSMIYIYTRDVDAAYERAIKTGAQSIMEPADQYYGDRSGSVQGPFGNYFWIATPIEDVASEELNRRAKDRIK